MNQEQELIKSVKEAESITKDPKAVEVLADKAQKKARSRGGKVFQRIGKDLESLIRLARAWAGGKYKDINIGSLLIVVGAIVYLLDPFDVLPDFLPLIGFTDDATVIGLAISRVRKELDKFEDWETEITLK